MPRGDKTAYTDKQKRQAEHIEEGYEKRRGFRQTSGGSAFRVSQKSCRHAEKQPSEVIAPSGGRLR